MKNLKALLGIFILFIVMASCSSDSSSNTNKMRIIAKATYSNTANKNAAGLVMNSDVVVTSFKINIKQIEFEVGDAF